MKEKIILLMCLATINAFCQVRQTDDNFFQAKEFSKDIALFKAKEFVMEKIIGVTTELTKFEIDPLAASSSGQLTSLVYSCKEKNLSGLVLGFYGDRWNQAGVVYQAYSFKHLTEVKAIELLNKIDNFMSENLKYLNSSSDNNNIFFKYDDMTFLIYRDGAVKIRIFWNDFDSEWEEISFGKTKRRFEKAIKN